MRYHRPLLKEVVEAMGRCEKLLEKARESPGNLRFSELRRLAECYGFEFDRSRGSHFIYKRPGYPRLMSFQEGRGGEAKKYQVKQLLAALEDLDLI